MIPPSIKTLKKHLAWSSALLVLGLAACNQPAKTTITKKDTAANQGNTPLTAARAATVANDSTAPSGCPRGTAEPVLKKTVFHNALFALQQDSSGIEKLKFPGGDQLTIRQSGCEYYILTFQFETNRFSADTTDLSFWGNAALSLMQEVNKGLDTPLDINAALSKLSAILTNDKPGNKYPLKPGDEIDFGGPDPRQYLVINHITKLSAQRYLVELSFNYGPI